MISSLFAGISGLNANATAMTVIGDNIANVNTVAYKSNSSAFANVLSASLSGIASNGIGRGVEVWGINSQWSQGTLENTSNSTDLSIIGKGFFMVNDDTGSTYYTRAGLFYLNEVGDFVNPDGLMVQGYEIDQNGNLGNLTDVSIPGDRISAPQSTTEFTFDLNLDAGAAVGDTFSASQNIYDSLGNAIALTLTFTNTAAGEWDCVASVPVSDGGPLPNVQIDGAASMTVEFDSDGVMIDPAGLPNPQLDITIVNGATDPLSVDWTLYDPADISYGDITGYAGESVMTFQYQDGFDSGVLRDIIVDEDGIVTAAYSNGQLDSVFQIALADFASYEGLTKLGNNLYSESRASGQPMPGVAGQGRIGKVSPNSIEMSNVDLAQEFVKMITTQRAFQANSKVITTSDEILAELINIKR
jgi:flagellar hook protein FlgE